MNDPDLELLQISCFLYEFRKKESSQNEHLENVSKWLQDSGKLVRNTDYILPINITSLSTNFPRLLDVINIYSPDYPLDIYVQSNHFNNILKKLDFSSKCLVQYRGEGFSYIPCLHGGCVSVEGMIDGLDLKELLKSSDPRVVFKTCITASYVDVDIHTINSLLDILYLKLEQSNDLDLFRFSLKGKLVTDILINTKPIFIRVWKISSFVDNYGILHIDASKDFI